MKLGKPFLKPKHLMSKNLELLQSIPLFEMRLEVRVAALEAVILDLLFGRSWSSWEFDSCQSLEGA